MVRELALPFGQALSALLSRLSSRVDAHVGGQPGYSGQVGRYGPPLGRYNDHSAWVRFRPAIRQAVCRHVVQSMFHRIIWVPSPVMRVSPSGLTDSALYWASEGNGSPIAWPVARSKIQASLAVPPKNASDDPVAAGEKHDGRKRPRPCRSWADRPACACGGRRSGCGRRSRMSSACRAARCWRCMRARCCRRWAHPPARRWSNRTPASGSESRRSPRIGRRA